MASAKDFAAAERHAQKAFELAPEDAEVLAALALLAQAVSDAEAASNWADRALATDSDNRTARLIKARLAAETGETDAALEWLDALIEERPGEMDANVAKSRLLHTAGRQEALRAHLARMAELFPDPWIKNWLASLQEQVGDTAGAYEMLKALSAQQPGNVQAAHEVVEFVGREHGAEAARDEFAARIAAADAPAARQLRLELATFEEAEGRPEEAMRGSRS
jgi:lipopolysaccharide biosynthesis regulator YciM